MVHHLPDALVQTLFHLSNLWLLNWWGELTPLMGGKVRRAITSSSGCHDWMSYTFSLYLIEVIGLNSRTRNFQLSSDWIRRNKSDINATEHAFNHCFPLSLLRDGTDLLSWLWVKVGSSDPWRVFFRRRLFLEPCHFLPAPFEIQGGDCKKKTPKFWQISSHGRLRRKYANWSL